MRKLLLLSFLILPFYSWSIDAYFNQYLLVSPEEGPYIETHMKFNASSLEHTQNMEGWQSTVELTYVFQQGESIAKFSKTLVKSPFNDSLNLVQDFIDLQRFFLAAGDYDLQIKIVDVNKRSDSVEFSQPISIPAHEDKPMFSDFIFIEEIAKTTSPNIFTRGNMDMIPRISSYQSPENTDAKFYIELYNMDSKLGERQPFLLNLDIIDLRSNEPIGQYHIMKRMSTAHVIPVFHQWQIEDLPTGSYIVRAEARDRNNAVVASKVIAMQRHNNLPEADSLSDEALQRTFVHDITGEDSIRNMCYCLIYQGTTSERQYLEANWKKADTTELKRFMYDFWKARNPLDPEISWKMYYKHIRFVERTFDIQRRHACATDRGKTYLTYGKPETRVMQRSEPNTYPYEIWHYYKLPKRANAKFAFVDKTIVTNDYVLIHSNVPGEPFDAAWYLQLNTRNANPMVTDDPQTNQEVMDINNLNSFDMGQVGSRALDFWNNPR